MAGQMPLPTGHHGATASTLLQAVPHHTLCHPLKPGQEQYVGLKTGLTLMIEALWDSSAGNGLT